METLDSENVTNKENIIKKYENIKTDKLADY